MGRIPVRYRSFFTSKLENFSSIPFQRARRNPLCAERIPPIVTNICTGSGVVELIPCSLCERISDLTSARICFFCLFRRILILSFYLLFVFCAELNSYTGLPVLVCEKELSWQQTFFMRVISLSPVRWFFSLLNEQW